MHHFRGDWGVIGGDWRLLASSPPHKTAPKIVFRASCELEKVWEQITIIILELEMKAKRCGSSSTRRSWFLEFCNVISGKFLEFYCPSLFSLPSPCFSSTSCLYFFLFSLSSPPFLSLCLLICPLYSLTDPIFSELLFIPSLVSWTFSFRRSETFLVVARAR